ncbi:DUF4174 domain-containing protein [Sphingomonas aerophila]|uniref:DUF4174 domain-containing protein n=1 Tax=Sphingomonas aerophila TaxID=1344948 RepID=A0A7W9BG45_9SPHN|nr:DUF4174 domain-containing protein [Sphingomonas aerophila]MBB5716398.1 hypothetical protein [Sphingomonas aerophila]
MKSLLLLAAAVPLLAAAAAPSMDELRWHRRVLLVAAPVAGDHALLEQRRILSAWKEGAAERDLHVVEIAGPTVSGVRDTAAALRTRYHLPVNGFAALLIGKDGHVAIRQAAPIAPDALQSAIDAMPMRRAGRR